MLRMDLASLRGCWVSRHFERTADACVREEVGIWIWLVFVYMLENQRLAQQSLFSEPSFEYDDDGDGKQYPFHLFDREQDACSL